MRYNNRGKHEKPGFWIDRSRIGRFEPNNNLKNLENPDYPEDPDNPEETDIVITANDKGINYGKQFFK